MTADQMKDKKQEEFEDDGMTVVNMDVDGMPHNILEPYIGSIFRRNLRQRQEDDKAAWSKQARRRTNDSPSSVEPLTRGEFWNITLNTWLAGLFVALIYGIGFGLLVLFIRLFLH